MSQVTGGIVSYERKTQPAQYEGKHAKAELTFSVGEGEDFAGMFALAAAAAEQKVLELVGLKKPNQPTTTAPASAPTGNDQHGPDIPLQGKEAAAAAMNAKDAAKANKPPKANKKNEKPTSDGTELPTDQKPQISANPENRSAPDDDLLDDTPAPISDQAMEAAAKAKKDKLGDGGGAKVRGLRDKFTGTTTKAVREIDPAKRADFMKELEALT